MTLANVTLPDVPNLLDFYQGDETQFKPLEGWHRGTILGSYTDKNGVTREPSDDLNQQGGRTLQLFIEFHNKTSRAGTQLVRSRFNYRLDDLGRLTELPKGYDKTWDTDSKRIWFTRTWLAGMQKALGSPVRFTGDNGESRIDVTQFIGKTIDVHLQLDKNGFSDVNGFNPFAPAGAKTK